MSTLNTNFIPPITIFNHRQQIFHAINPSDTPPRETDTMIIREFISIINIPPNRTSSAIEYRFEIYLRNVPTGITSTVTVKPAINDEFQYVFVGDFGPGQLSIKDGSLNFTMVCYITKGAEHGDCLQLSDIPNIDVIKKLRDSNGNLMFNGNEIIGLPPGGEEGMQLTKKSDEDYDVDWTRDASVPSIGAQGVKDAIQKVKDMKKGNIQHPQKPEPPPTEPVEEEPEEPEDPPEEPLEEEE